MEPLLVIDDARELTRSVEAARIAGFRTFSVPAELPRGIDVLDVVSNLRDSRDETPVLFAGYIPLRERYESLTSVLREKGYRVLVSPRAHRQMLEVDSSAAALGALTAPLVIIDDVTRAVELAKPLGFPLFLKGAVQSLKHEGVDACVARDEDALQRIVRAVLRHTAHSRGRVIARPLLKLRHVRNAPNGLPAGREYRAVVFRGEVLGLAPYWDGVDSLTALTHEEAEQVNALAVNAATRFESPLVGVDIGQAEDGRWWIIETNDPQFMGLSQLEPLKLWHRLWSALHTRPY